MSGAFDWAALIRAGFARGLRPEDVWRMTPGEFALLAGAGGAAMPLTRDRLAALERAFPDERNEVSNG
ncbi:phage tail assembly chaperone [Alphaproteobacteria bacterium GH1-50]|uniref:Phage tail assembly chaperone n=1 Tax=Kangsaoukella pontilimi TaxID=2691042 RepID=A0A7C9MQR4_9RHOB|nr:phage tail assembly chaperone [Kangsaoukella pontilimi]MXQ07637.1 phage tail assembly chaperone [Kangsaoukella pontilimi]